MKLIEIAALLAPALSDESEGSQDAVKGSALLQMVTHSAVVRDNFIEDSFDASHGKQTDADPHDRFHSTEKMVLGLVSESIHNNRSMIEDNTKQILASIKTQIKEAKTDDLAANHDLDSASLQTHQDQLNTCVSDHKAAKIAAFATTSTGQLEVMNGHDVAHSTCRGEQKALVATRDADCGTLTTYIDGLTGVDQYKKPNRGGNTGYFSNIEAFVTTNKAHWAALEDACVTAEQNVVDKDTACDALQATFESYVCSFEGQIWSDCSTYSACYETKLAAWNTEKAAVAEKEELRKHEVKVFDRLMCLLDVLINTADESDVNQLSTDVDTCKTATYDDATMSLQTELNWEPPAKEICDMAAVHVHPNGADDTFFATLHGYGTLCRNTRSQLPTDNSFTDLDDFMTDVSQCAVLPTISNNNHVFDDTRSSGHTIDDCKALAVSRGMVFMQAYDSQGTNLQDAGCYTYKNKNGNSYCQVWYAGATGATDVSSLTTPVASDMELLRADVKPSEEAMTCLTASPVAADTPDPIFSGR